MSFLRAVAAYAWQSQIQSASYSTSDRRLRWEAIDPNGSPLAGAIALDFQDPTQARRFCNASQRVRLVSMLYLSEELPPSCEEEAIARLALESETVDAISYAGGSGNELRLILNGRPETVDASPVATDRSVLWLGRGISEGYTFDEVTGECFLLTDPAGEQYRSTSRWCDCRDRACKHRRMARALAGSPHKRRIVRSRFS